MPWVFQILYVKHFRFFNDYCATCVCSSSQKDWINFSSWKDLFIPEDYQAVTTTDSGSFLTISEDNCGTPSRKTVTKVISALTPELRLINKLGIHWEFWVSAATSEYSLVGVWNLRAEVRPGRAGRRPPSVLMLLPGRAVARLPLSW